MDGIVRANHKISADAFQPRSGIKHEIAHGLPIILVYGVHVEAERMVVHADLGMIVRTADLRPLGTDRAVTEFGAGRAAGHNADVLEFGWHECSVSNLGKSFLHGKN